MYDPNCLECKLQRHIAQQSSVPDHVLKVFEEAIEEAEGGVTGWLKSINSYRLVRLLTYPARLPYNVAMGLVSRLSALQPIIAQDSLMRKTLDSLIGQLYNYATTGGYLQPSHRAKYTCEFNITQYGEQSMSPVSPASSFINIKEQQSRDSRRERERAGKTRIHACVFAHGVQTATWLAAVLLPCLLCCINKCMETNTPPVRCESKRGRAVGRAGICVCTACGQCT